MAGVNKVILLGNLGKDPEIRVLENGNKVANFTLATNRSYKARDGQTVDETEWHNISLWGNLADLAEKYLAKGRQVFIEGRIRTRQWDDKDGNKRYTTEIIGEYMTFVGSRDERSGQGRDQYQGNDRAQTERAPQSSSNDTSSFTEADDDLPF